MSEEENTQMVQSNMYPPKKDSWMDWIKDNKLIVFVIIVVIIAALWWWWSGRSTETGSSGGSDTQFTITKLRGGNFY